MKIKLKISIFGILMLLILMFGDNSAYTAVAILAAAIHELGHIICAHFLKIKMSQMTIGILGARLNITESNISYKKEFLLCFSGPLANIISAISMIFLYHISKSDASSIYILFYIVASFFLAALNLLPIKSFDGGRMLICVLASKIDLYKAEKIICYISFCIIFLLWIISMYLMLKLGTSLTLFVFSTALFADLFLEDK